MPASLIQRPPAATPHLPAGPVAATATRFDALGNPVRTHPLPARASEITFDIHGLAPGLYVVRCGAASGRLVVE